MKKRIVFGIAVVATVAAFLCFLPVRMQAELAVAGVYQYEDLTPEDLLVTAESLVGFTYQVNEYELTGVDLNEASKIAHFEKLYLSCDLTLTPILLESIQTEYRQEMVHAGEDFHTDSVDVTFVYSDGSRKGHEAFSIDRNPNYITEEDYTVFARVDDFTLEAGLTIPVIPIVEVEAEAEYNWFADDEVNPIAYRLIYEDGSSRRILGDEAQVISENPVIAEGDNSFEIAYHELNYTFQCVGVEKMLTAAKAVEKTQFYIDEAIPEDQFAFELHFEDNSVAELAIDDPRIQFEDADRLLIFGENEFHAAFKEQEFDFTVNAIEREVASVSPLSYEAYLEENLNLLTIQVNYSDGGSAEKTDFTVLNPEALQRGENVCRVSYHEQEYEIIVEATSYRPILSVSVYVPEDTMEGDVFAFSELTVTYDNGKEQAVPANQIELLSDLTLVEGDNEISFRYREQELAFTVHAHPQTAARLARRNYASDYTYASYRYCSDNIFVTINKANSAYGVYYLTHVILSDPSHIRGGLSNDNFWGRAEKPTKAASRMNWIVGTNGGYFNISNGTSALAGVYIKNGTVMSGTRSNGYEICLKKDGTLYSPGYGVSAQTLISQGVIESYGTYLPVLISGGVGMSDGSNGYVMPDQVENAGMSQRFDVIYPRTVYGMVKPCEYYIITSGEKSYYNGTTLAECRDILLAKGCTFARPMDGGGSASLVFRGQLVNLPAPKGVERAVADYLYFVD